MKVRYSQKSNTNRGTKQQLSKIETEGVNECSPLLMACQEGNETTVRYLLDAGADIDTLDKDKCSPLYLACQNGHDNIAQLLLKKGAAINKCNKDGTSPLFIHCSFQKWTRSYCGNFIKKWHW